VAAFSRPADETGGDIYDLVMLEPPPGADGRRRSMMILLADATGHGIGPALSVTQSRAMLRIGLRFSQNLDELLANINSQLTEDLASNRFITAFLGVLDTQKHRVAYHAPGQGPLLHFQSARRHCQWYNASALPLGIFDDAEMEPPPPIELAPGDMLVLLTDGFYEYQNGTGDQFGNDGVWNVVSDNAHRGSQDIIDALLESISNFADGAPQNDDLTAIVVKRTDSE
jgi:phosphoserine phosphatase